MIGLQPTKADVDYAAGQTAKLLQLTMNNIEKFKYWLDATSDGELTAFGYAAGDIATLRSAFADMQQLGGLYRGTTNLAVAKDFRTFARRVWGLGDL